MPGVLRKFAGVFELRSMTMPPLKFLHPEESLVELKLAQMRELSSEELIDSLRPEQPHALKVRPDGAILDGHHRICILKERGVDVDSLPREVWGREL